MRPYRERESNCGFTLLEILVALAIFALAFGVLVQIIQTGLHQSTVARSMAASSLVAKSELARVGVELPLQAGQVDGETEDGKRWRTEIELLDGPHEGQSFSTYRVQVTVAWGASPAEELTLTTLRVGVPPE